MISNIFHVKKIIFFEKLETILLKIIYQKSIEIGAKLTISCVEYLAV